MKKTYIIECEGKDYEAIKDAFKAAVLSIVQRHASAGFGLVADEPSTRFAIASVNPEERPDLNELIALTMQVDKLINDVAEAMTKPKKEQEPEKPKAEDKPTPADELAALRAMQDVLTKMKGGVA